MATPLELARRLQKAFPESISDPQEFRGEISLVVRDASKILEVLRHAKTECGFNLLVDITSVDHMGTTPRFEVVYHLYSFKEASYLRIKTFVGEETPELASATSVWKAAEWHEREIFDMMGIAFTDHPYLKRILMWEGYPHHPLRKEFPLAGIPVGDGVVKDAPMAGGPFVTVPGDLTTVDREPRSRS
jgi:NADH-quinone oxidoreductase subunit C